MSLPAFGNCNMVASGLKKQDHSVWVLVCFFLFSTDKYTCLTRMQKSIKAKSVGSF